MRTRIKVETLENGTVIYTPQYRFLFFWGSIGNGEYSFSTRDLALAKKCIDDALGKESKSVKYMRYPWYPNGYN